MKSYNRIPLESVYNLRGFAGYQVDGGVTNFGKVFRSGEIVNPTKKDGEYITEKLGVKTIIDLRTKKRFDENKNFFLNSDKVNIYNIPLFENLEDERSKDFKNDGDNLPKMAYSYILLVEDRQNEIKEVINIIADNINKGAVLYHCFAGKDRAGMITVLLQGIVGMDRYDILADYSLSTPLWGALASQFNNKTIPELLIPVLDHLDKKYNSIYNYLLDIGIEEDTLLKIKEILIDKTTSQKEKDMVSRRVILESVDNFRCPGGFATKDGGITNFSVFYRCGLPHIISESDLARIKDLNIKTVIDLRSAEERKSEPNGFEKDSFFNVIHIDVLKDLDPTRLVDMGDKKMSDMKVPTNMSEVTEEQKMKFFMENADILANMYIHILSDKKDVVLEILNDIADNIDKGGVLFHCTAGKDRTGVTAMLLHKIAGVDDRDIVADYRVSEIYLKQDSNGIFGSKPEYMEIALKHFNNNLGGIDKYLDDIGFSKERKQKIFNAYVSI